MQAAGAGAAHAPLALVAVVAQLAAVQLRLRPVDLLVLPEAAGVGVALVAAADVAVVRLVRGVDMHVLLTVTRVGESPITAGHLALERFLACKNTV